jgi:hypothetical protein
LSKKFFKVLAPHHRHRTVLIVPPDQYRSASTATTLAPVDVDRTTAAMLGVDHPVETDTGAGSGCEPFDAAALSAATAVLAQMQVALRIAAPDRVADTIGEIYDRADMMIDVPDGALGAAATLVDQVRDHDYPAIAWNLHRSMQHYGETSVLVALSALIASFTMFLADALDLDRGEAFAEIVERRHTLGMQHHRAFCRAHRP